jgi:hypothetical protein
LIEFVDALGGHDRANLEMILKTMIEPVRRCTGRARLSMFVDAIGDRDQVSLEMQSETVIE